MLGIFIAIVFLIVYGSLYPWDFVSRDLPANPLWILAHSWGGVRDRRFIADVIVNIALYVPFGMSGHLAFRKWRVAGPILLAVLVSASVEMLQLYTPSRVCSALDFVNNSLGAVLGVLLGALFERLAGRNVIEFGRGTQSQRPALALLFCGIGSLLFPLYPEMHLMMLREGLARFVHGPVFATVPFLSATAIWFVGGRLLKATGLPYAGLWLAAALVLLPAQFLIVTRRPLPVDFLGAVTGVVLFVAFGPICASTVPRARILASAFVGLLLLRGLVPFHLGASHGFAWIPFEGFLDMNWQTGIQVMLEKTLWYGCAIWLLWTSGLGFRSATAVTMAALAIIEAIQTHLPGRTAELTDPLLGLFIGCGLWTLDRRRRFEVELLPTNKSPA